MTTTTSFFFFIPLLAIILLAVNFFLAPHNPYMEKDSPFECGYHSFLSQNRTQFSISFFIFGLLFLLFDLEILLVYPFVVSSYTVSVYGLTIMLIFFGLLGAGFVYELGRDALKIDSRQTDTLNKNSTLIPHSYVNSQLTNKISLMTFFKHLTWTNILTGLIVFMGLFIVRQYILTELYYPLTLTVFDNISQVYAINRDFF